MAVHLLFMQLDNPVHNWDVPAFHLEDKDLTSLQWFILVVSQEEKVPSIECRLHTTTGWIGRGYFCSFWVSSDIKPPTGNTLIVE